MIRIKGTQIYDPARGGFVDVGILDVMQIFGRAGRPQFDDRFDLLSILPLVKTKCFYFSGEATIITTHDKVPHYLALMAHQLPIESQFIQRLSDHLNAEIVLGTVTNIVRLQLPEVIESLSMLMLCIVQREAIVWLSYTYLYVRMLKNPLVYGSTIMEKALLILSLIP